jgi:probable rRNA maturation factor
MSSGLFPGRSVALQIVDDEAIRKLNRDYRNVDRSTDILSFPDEAGSIHAGDLALSWPTAQLQARANGNSVEDECIALVAHGLLHLAGYTHDTDEDDAAMQRRTLELLAAQGINLTTFGHD